MLGLKYSLTIAVLISCYTIANAEEPKIYSRKWVYPRDSPNSFREGTLFTTDNHNYPFASCLETKLHVEKVCNVTLVTPGREDRTCNDIKLYAGKDRVLFYNGYFQAWPFGQNQIIVGWWDETKEANRDEKKHNIKFTIVNMDKCTNTHLDYPVDKTSYDFFPSLIVYSDRIDIIIKSQTACNGAEKCRLTYDIDGKQIGNPRPYEPNILGYGNPVSAVDPKKGTFIYVRDEKNMTVLLVNEAGQGLELLTDTFEDKSIERIVFASNDEQYAICRSPESANTTKIHCAQFDAQGKTKVKGTITIPKTLYWMTVRNLPEGGIILATTGHKSSKSFEVFKFGLNGKLSKPLELKGVDLSEDDRIHFDVRISENDKNEVCIDMTSAPSVSRLNYVSYCIQKEVIQSLA